MGEKHRKHEVLIHSRSTVLNHCCLFAEELEGKVKSLANFERLQDLQNCLVWPSIIELDPKTYVPEVSVNNIHFF